MNVSFLELFSETGAGVVGEAAWLLGEAGRYC